MQQQQPPQKPITYFIVQPDAYQAVCTKLSKLPYDEVAGLLQEFVGSSRAMFDPLPGSAPPAGPGGKKPAAPGANGNGSEPPAGLTDRSRPGWTEHASESDDKNCIQEYDAANDCWWRKNPPEIDSGDPGGAK